MRVCPRCGLPYRSIEEKGVNGRIYLVAYHGKVNGKPQVCYLGPRDGYVAVSRVKGTDLENLTSESMQEIISMIAAYYHRRRVEADRVEEIPERVAVWRRILEDFQHLRDVAEDILREAERQLKLWEREAELERKREEAAWLTFVEGG